MKYDVKFSCGHTATVELFGSYKDRERKIKYYEQHHVCPDCYLAQQTAGCEEVEMHYSEYKNNYADCKTKANSYDKRAKTIIVYVPREDIQEEAPVEAAETETTVEATTEQAATETEITTVEASAETTTEQIETTAAPATEPIQGLGEIRQAQSQWSAYREKFADAMERGTGIFPAQPKIDIEALNQQYPRAAAYIQAERFAHAAHYAKSAAGKKAMARIINGDDCATALEDMQAEWSDYAESRMWD